MFAATIGMLAGAATAAAVLHAGAFQFPDAQRLAAGTWHTCAVEGDGAVLCWGDNRDGQLGDGTKTSRAAPAAVKDLQDAVEVVAGSDHTCARRRGGEVVCWGSAEHGEVGDGTQFEGTARERVQRMRERTTASRTTPTAVALPGPADAIFAGRGLSCARVAGKPWCWGRMPDAKQGSGTPAPLAGVEAFDQMVMGWGYLCVRSGGEVACRMPHAGSVDASQEFIKLAGIADAVAISGGRDHVCVLRRTGELACMGNIPVRFERDDGPREWSTMMKLGELTDAVRLTAGGNGDHACAMRRGGEVRCWGTAREGQLGHGLFQEWRRPVAVIGVDAPRALVAGGDHSCALTEDRRVLCWGGNGAGQLGWEPAKIEVPELRKGRGGNDEIAMQLRTLVRASATAVVAVPQLSAPAQ